MISALQLLSAYYMPGTVLNSLHTLIHLIIKTILCSTYDHQIQYYKLGNYIKRALQTCTGYTTVTNRVWISQIYMYFPPLAQGRAHVNHFIINSTYYYFCNSLLS